MIGLNCKSNFYSKKKALLSNRFNINKEEKEENTNRKIEFFIFFKKKIFPLKN